MTAEQKGKIMVWALLWIGVVVFAFQAFFLDPMLKPESLGGYFFVGLFYVFVCGFAGIIAWGIGYGIGQAFGSYPVEGRRSSLLAIRDKDGVEGRFFLGSGFISSQPYYFYYETLPDGGARPGKVSADKGVTVREEDRTDAELVTFDWHIKYPAWAWIVCIQDSSGSGQSYVFHVPRGTIKTGYLM
jgi:hypothetical protein